jgi:hypothetical protein
MGVVPGFFLRPMEPSIARTIERVTGSQPARVGNGSVHQPAGASAAPALREQVAASALPAGASAGVRVDRAAPGTPRNPPVVRGAAAAENHE